MRESLRFTCLAGQLLQFFHKVADRAAVGTCYDVDAGQGFYLFPGILRSEGHRCHAQHGKVVQMVTGAADAVGGNGEHFGKATDGICLAVVVFSIVNSIVHRLQKR